MTDEEIWMRYFAGAFAGRQGSLSQEYINDYKDWADVALKSHRDRWPAPADHEERIVQLHKSCGCVTCVCESEIQCGGCGAKNCGNHPSQAPVDQPEICESPECAVKHTHATTDCAPVESKPKDAEWACEKHKTFGPSYLKCSFCADEPAADTAKPSPEKR